MKNGFHPQTVTANRRPPFKAQVCPDGPNTLKVKRQDLTPEQQSAVRKFFGKKTVVWV